MAKPSAPKPASTPSDNNNVQAAQAAASLQLLLQEDTLLRSHGLTLTEGAPNPEQVAFSYAAALLSEDDGTVGQNTQQKANLALQEVERKLTLVESLAVKLSRTSPEAVAGPLLRLHGYKIVDTHGTSAASGPTGSTLSMARDRAQRLERQAHVLENIARRVEQSWTRGQNRMQTTTLKLENVLQTSQALKMILQLQFEANKLDSYVLEDVRDLTRAAASVAHVEDLLSQPELASQQRIVVVEALRPRLAMMARNVRQAAAALLEEHYDSSGGGSGSATGLAGLSQLGPTLQVYYHLGELPQAVWKAVENASAQAEQITKLFLNADNLQALNDQAKHMAKEARGVSKKLNITRSEAASNWSQGIAAAATQVQNLQRVLRTKTDPIRRQVYMDVVANAPIPMEYAETVKIVSVASFSLFNLFWGRFCKSFADTVVEVGSQDQGRLIPEVSALYPSIRAATLQLLSLWLDDGDSGSTGLVFDDTAGTTSTYSGILGGSILLQDPFLGIATEGSFADNPQSADSWTRTAVTDQALASSSPNGTSAVGLRTMSAVMQSQEWKTLQSDERAQSGLYSLQQIFLESCSARLCEPLQFMFPDNIEVDEDGVAIASGLRVLPSKYDVQRFDENIRQELSLADPRQGGGELTVATMIADCVVKMIIKFCAGAKKALSGAGEHGYIEDDWSMTEALQHDRKVVAIMYTLSTYLKNAPEKTFLAPYRPTSLPSHEEAASLCEESLLPARQEIDKMVLSAVLTPLCRSLNRRLAGAMAKMHLGVYMETSSSSLDDEAPAFVQKHLSQIYETISHTFLGKFPPQYASVIVSMVVKFSIYTFLSNIVLIRPLSESVRLHITQDLADFEMALEQFVLKAGGSMQLTEINGGGPYAELRAVRQMLFWSGLENRSKAGSDIAKSLLREPWIKDVRPSTVLHFLFSMAPALLSSPHHTKRIKVEEYVSTLVQLDGSVDSTEDKAWVTIMSCCDAYQQRASSATSAGDDLGDPRVAEVLLSLGPELLRRLRD